MIQSDCICKKNCTFIPFIVYKNETVFKEYEGSIIGKCKNCEILKTIPSRKNKKFNPLITKFVDYEKRRSEFERLFQPIVSSICQYIKPNSSVLDVGCSSGILLSLLKQKKHNVWGIEPNKQAFLYVQKKQIKNIFNGSLSQFIKKSKQKFDCVIYNHVLEHIEDINREFQLVNKVLKKNGLIIIGVPNTDNIIFKIRNKYWEYLLPNEHVWHFNTKYLERFLSAHKYTVLGKKFKDDDRLTYPFFKKLYFGLLTYINNVIRTGETVLLIARKNT